MKLVLTLARRQPGRLREQGPGSSSGGDAKPPSEREILIPFIMDRGGRGLEQLTARGDKVSRVDDLPSHLPDRVHISKVIRADGVKSCQPWRLVESVQRIQPDGDPIKDT